MSTETVKPQMNNGMAEDRKIPYIGIQYNVLSRVSGVMEAIDRVIAAVVAQNIVDDLLSFRFLKPIITAKAADSQR
jgi:hypothetical protein